MKLHYLSLLALLLAVGLSTARVDGRASQLASPKTRLAPLRQRVRPTDEVAATGQLPAAVVASNGAAACVKSPGSPVGTCPAGHCPAAAQSSSQASLKLLGLFVLWYGFNAGCKSSPWLCLYVSPSLSVDSYCAVNPSAGHGRRA